jgi:hypothetical protein
MHRKGTSIYACPLRKGAACSNKVTLPPPALEARVREALDAIVKDPARLKELVAEHNRKLDEKNDQQRAVVRGLEADRDRIAQEAARLVDAIAQGTGAAAMIVAKVQRHEQKLVELEARISDAEALIQPLLVPTTATKLADYVTGSATIFLDEYARNRALVERVLDKILVYASGEIVLVFRPDSLFAPVMTATVTAVSKSASREEHRAMFDTLKERVGENARFWVHETGRGTTYASTTGRRIAADDDDGYGLNGSGEIALATPTGQGRDFASADAGLDEIALATPTGFEPVLPA